MPNDYQDWIRKVVIPVSFRSLTDTPGSFDGAVQKTIVVNDTETALVYSNINLHDHSARHEEGAADEISVAGLSGVLADKQDPQDHGSRHEGGGADPVNIVNLPDYEETTVELDGDFDADQFIKCVRIGNMVTITCLEYKLYHASASVPSTTSDLIPASFRPAQSQNFSYASYPANMDVKADAGFFKLAYYDSTGSLVSRTDSYWSMSMTYNI